MIPTCLALNGGRPLTWIAPNSAIGPGRYRKRQRREMRLMIDFNVLVTKPCFGETLLAKRMDERFTSGDDVFGNDRIAGLYSEGGAQLRRVGACGLEPR